MKHALTSCNYTFRTPAYQLSYFLQTIKQWNDNLLNYLIEAEISEQVDNYGINLY